MHVLKLTKEKSLLFLGAEGDRPHPLCLPLVWRADSRIMAEHEQKTKLSLSKASMNMAQQAETAPLKAAGRVHEVAKTAALVHRWEDRKDPGILNVAVLAGGKAAFQLLQQQGKI